MCGGGVYSGPSGFICTPSLIRWVSVCGGPSSVLRYRILVYLEGPVRNSLGISAIYPDSRGVVPKFTADSFLLVL